MLIPMQMMYATCIYNGRIEVGWRINIRIMGMMDKW